MAQIQPISTWYQGQERQANVFNLYGTGNNLINLGSASFKYELVELIVISPEEQTSQTLVSGDLSIHGAEYEQYCSETDPNAWIYQWAATKLNLVIIS